MQVPLLVPFISGWILLKNYDGRHHQAINRTWKICHSPGDGQRVDRNVGLVSSRSIIFCWKKCVNVSVLGEPSKQVSSRILKLLWDTFKTFDTNIFHGEKNPEKLTTTTTSKLILLAVFLHSLMLRVGQWWKGLSRQLCLCITCHRDGTWRTLRRHIILSLPYIDPLGKPAAGSIHLFVVRVWTLRSKQALHELISAVRKMEGEILASSSFVVCRLIHSVIYNLMLVKQTRAPVYGCHMKAMGKSCLCGLYVTDLPIAAFRIGEHLQCTT